MDKGDIFEYIAQINNPEVQVWFKVWRDFIGYPTAYLEIYDQEFGQKTWSLVGVMPSDNSCKVAFHYAQISESIQAVNIALLPDLEKQHLCMWQKGSRKRADFTVVFSKEWHTGFWPRPFCHIMTYRSIGTEPDKADGEIKTEGPLRIEETENHRFITDLPHNLVDPFDRLRALLREDFYRLPLPRT